MDGVAGLSDAGLAGAAAGDEISGCGLALAAGAAECEAGGVVGGWAVGCAGVVAGVSGVVAGWLAGGSAAGAVGTGVESAAAGSRWVSDASERSGTTVTGMFSVCTVPGSSRSLM